MFEHAGILRRRIFEEAESGNPYPVILPAQSLPMTVPSEGRAFCAAGFKINNGDIIEAMGVAYSVTQASPLGVVIELILEAVDGDIFQHPG